MINYEIRQNRLEEIRIIIDVKDINLFSFGSEIDKCDLNKLSRREILHNNQFNLLFNEQFSFSLFQKDTNEVKGINFKSIRRDLIDNGSNEKLKKYVKNGIKYYYLAHISLRDHFLHLDFWVVKISRRYEDYVSIKSNDNLYSYRLSYHLLYDYESTKEIFDSLESGQYTSEFKVSDNSNTNNLQDLLSLFA